MVDCDEKIDDLVDSVHRIETGLKVLETRVDSIDKTLQHRAEALTNIYMFMQNTESRLIKIETNREGEAAVRSWFAPYIIAVFSSVVSFAILHFWGK